MLLDHGKVANYITSELYSETSDTKWSGRHQVTDLVM